MSPLVPIQGNPHAGVHAWTNICGTSRGDFSWCQRRLNAGLVTIVPDPSGEGWSFEVEVDAAQDLYEGYGAPSLDEAISLAVSMGLTFRVER